MKRASPVLVPVLVVAVAALLGGALSRTEVPALVQFHGTGPAGFKIEGKTSALDVKEDDKNLTIIVALKDITTGISLRDNHMRNKYLEIDKYPDTRLVVDKSTLKIPAAGAASEADAKGTLTLHGKSKDVTFHYKATCSAAGICDTTGSFPLNMNDFGIVIPVYLGVTMKPDVTVDTTFQTKR